MVGIQLITNCPISIFLLSNSLLENNEKDDRLIEVIANNHFWMNLTSEAALKMTFVNIPLRVIIFVMLCLANIISFISRGNMSIIILAMTHPIHNSTAEVPDYGHRYHWTAYDQSLVIGSYFWGHILVTLVSGIVAEKYGPRKIAGFGFAFGAFLSASIPIAAQYFWLLVTIRFFLGFAMGTISPSLQAAISNWAPPDEIGKFQSAFLASGIGVVIDWCMSGFIIEHFGWTYAFYACAAVLGLFSIVWFSVFYDCPSDHPKISVAEKEFILSKLNVAKSKPWPPFLSIFLSIPVWALVCLHFGILYPMYIFITTAPKYFSDVHHLNITTVGVLSSIPHLLRFPFAIFFGVFGDYLKKKTTISTSLTRKLFSIITHVIPAVALISLIFFENQPYVCVALMTISLGFASAVNITSLGNAHDLSPNFSTTVFSWMQTIGLTSGFIAPLVVTHFTEERSSEEEWRYVFLVGAGISIGSAIIFIIFGSGKVQSWNNVEDVNEPNNTGLKLEDGANK